MMGYLQKPIVYLDCNVVSFLTGWLSRQEDARAMQLATRAWWKRAQGRVQAVISDIVWTEIGDGGPMPQPRH